MDGQKQKSYEVSASAVPIYKNRFVLLFDCKKNHYVLPQGHNRKNESLLSTALREIKEETGFQELIPVEKLGKYQYHFKKGRKIIYKMIHVYLIKIAKSKRLQNTQRANENFKVHQFFFKDAVKMVKWKQDKKYIKIANRYLEI